MTVEEARAALSFEVDSDNPPYKEIMRLADAYGDARAQEAVEALIEKFQAEGEMGPTITLNEPEKYGGKPTGFIDLTSNGMEVIG